MSTLADLMLATSEVRTSVDGRFAEVCLEAMAFEQADWTTPSPTSEDATRILLERETLRDAITASYGLEAAYGGSIVMLLDRMLATYRETLGLDPKVRHDEKIGRLIGGYSFAAVIWAAANNHRHGHDWEKTNIPGGVAAKSVEVLKAALGGGWKHQPNIHINVCAEIVSLLSGPSLQFEEINKQLFAYALALAEGVKDEPLDPDPVAEAAKAIRGPGDATFNGSHPC